MNPVRSRPKKITAKSSVRTSNGVKTIVISGAHSNIGKTSLAEEMLREMPNWSALKVTVKRKNSSCPRESNCGVCDQLTKDFDIVIDEKIINQKGTDTARLKKAGAKNVIWLKANLKGLKKGLEKSLKYFKDSKGLIVEGNSVLKYIKPDLSIYLKNRNSSEHSSAKLAQKKADIIINVAKYK